MVKKMQPGNIFKKEGALYRIETGSSTYFVEFRPKADVRAFNSELGEPYTFRMKVSGGVPSYLPLYVNTEGGIYDDDGNKLDVREVSSEEVARELKRNGTRQQNL